MFKTLEETMDFCAEVKTGTMAALDNGSPVLRPHHFQMFKDNRCYFVLHSGRNAVKYLKENPTVQWMSHKMSSPPPIVRISGDARFIDDIDIKKMVFENNENHLNTRFKNGYKSDDFLVYTVDNCKIQTYMAGNSTTIAEFNL